MEKGWWVNRLVAEQLTSLVAVLHQYLPRPLGSCAIFQCTGVYPAPGAGWLDARAVTGAGA